MNNYNDDGNFNIGDYFKEHWNKKLKSLKATGIIVSIAMVALGIVLCIYPIQSVWIIEMLASISIICLGTYMIIDYAALPAVFQRGGILVNGILNIFIGIMLLCSPAAVSIGTFAFLFGFLLLMFGIDLITLSGKLSYFGISDRGWVIVTGIISICGSAAFFIMPLASSIALSYLIAIYLIIGGITVFIESICMKNLKIK